MLAQTADFSSTQRGGDPQRGEIGRADARPWSSREDRTLSISTPDEPVGPVELGVRPRTAIDELHGCPPPTLLVIEEAGPGSDEPVVTGTVTVNGVLTVGTDRTGDNAGIERAEGVVVDSEPRRRPPREAVDHDVGFLDESIELVTAIDTVQIKADTSLAPIPDPVPGLLCKRIT